MAIIIPLPPRRDGDFGAIRHGCRGEAVEPRRGEAEWSERSGGGFEIARQVSSENAPPTILSLAVEIQSRIAGPRRPAAVFTHSNTPFRFRITENNDIRKKIVKLAAPPPRPVRSDGDELPRRRDSGAEIHRAVRRQSRSSLIIEPCRVKGRPARERLLRAFVGGDEVEAAVVEGGAVMEEALRIGLEALGMSIAATVQKNLSRPGSLGDVNDGVVVIEEVAVEADGSAVGEAVLREIRVVEVRRETDGENIEAVVGSADGGEDYGTSWRHARS